MNEKKISLSAFFIMLLVIVIAVMAYFMYKFYNDKNLEEEKVSELNNKVNNLENTVNDLQNDNTLNTNDTDNLNDFSETDDEMIEQVIDFLTSGKIISTQSSVGASNPEMYYFTSNGKFAYMNVPFFTKEGETISSVGTWKIKDNSLVLTIKNEKKVKGGKMVKAEASDPYDHLENYKEEVSNSTYTKKYLIIDLIEDEDMTYNTYYLKLDKMDLFQLNLEDDEKVEELKVLAIKGSY